MACIEAFFDFFVFDRLRKTWPSAMGIEFVFRAEQRFAGDDIDIDAFFEMLVELALERRFSAVFLRDMVLHRRQFRFQIVFHFASPQ